MTDFAGTVSTFPTSFGDMPVTIIGDTSKPPLITFADIGLTYNSCFRSFFGVVAPTKLFDTFCIYNLAAPGSENGAAAWPTATTPYPTFEAVADAVAALAAHFKLPAAIGLGVGAGANVLLKASTEHSELFRGLILIGPTSKPSGLMEWTYEVIGKIALDVLGLASPVKEQLITRYFSPQGAADNQDHVEYLRRELDGMNPTNLALWIQSYGARQGFTENLKRREHVRYILFTGSLSYYLDDTVDLNGELPPERTSYLRVDEAGHLLTEENPKVLMEPIALFLQGLGCLVKLDDEAVLASRDAFYKPPADPVDVAAANASAEAALSSANPPAAGVIPPPAETGEV